MSENSRKQEFEDGVYKALPVALGFIPFALVLGAQASQKGFTPLSMIMMTGLNFAGGSEFAAIALWSEPTNLIMITAVTLLINSRHIVMGATMVPLLTGQPNRVVFPALFLMCDESWALSYAEAHRRKLRIGGSGFSFPFYMGVATFLYLVWSLFAALGTLIGPLLGDISRFGFDMAFPAVFLVILRGLWKGWKPAIPWFISLIAAAAAYKLIPGAWYVAIGSLSGLIFAFFVHSSEHATKS